MSILIRLFLVFLKIGAFSFGGGYAMLPFIEQEVVNSNQWLTETEFLDIIGISQATPGPIAINTATYWHALRSMGFADQRDGFGALLSRF